MSMVNGVRYGEEDFSWLEFDHKRCVRCGVCVDMCPMDVIYFGDHGYPYMRYRDDCWYCDACTFMCPRQAITMREVPYLIR